MVKSVYTQEAVVGSSKELLHDEVTPLNGKPWVNGMYKDER